MQLYSDKSRREVIDFLSGVDAYTLRKPTRKRFPRRTVYSKGIADLIQADIADLSHIARYNDNYRYLLTAIDVFSKRAWALPLKSKTGCEVAAAFENSPSTCARRIRVANSTMQHFDR